MTIVLSSLLVGVAIGFLFGLLFVLDKRKLLKDVDSLKTSDLKGKSSSFFIGISHSVLSFFRYLLLLITMYLLISRCNFSISYLILGYLISFWFCLAMAIVYKKKFDRGA